MMINQTRRPFYLISAALLATAAVAHAALQKVSSGIITVEARTRPTGAFTGTSANLGVSHANGQLRLTSDLRHADFGIRDQQFEQEFEVARFPNAILAIPEGELSFPSVGSRLSDTALATFTLHGITKPVRVSWDVFGLSSNEYRVNSATFTFRYTDFNVREICKVGVCVDPEVTVRLPNLTLRNN